MNKIFDYDQVFSTHLINGKMTDFPYPVKQCYYCNKDLTLMKAIHIIETPYEYKAIYVCFNKSCAAYDELAEKAYVKVYYSSQNAANILDDIKTNVIQPEKQ